MIWLEDPYRPGSSSGSALPSPAYCFVSVIVWSEQEIKILPYLTALFVLFWRWRPVFWGRQLKKVVNFLEGKSASGWPGWRILWPRNDLAPLLHWRRHWSISGPRCTKCNHTMTDCCTGYYYTLQFMRNVLEAIKPMNVTDIVKIIATVSQTQQFTASKSCCAPYSVPRTRTSRGLIPKWR